MAKRIQKPSGRSVYEDKKGRIVYFKEKTKTAYIIREEDYGRFTAYQNRYVIVITAFILLLTFLKDWRICLPVALVIGAFLEYQFRMKYLPACTQIQNWVPTADRKSMIDRLVEANDKKRTISLLVCYLLFAILLVLNGLEMKFDIPMMILTAAISCGALYFAVIHIIALSKMKK